MSNTTASMLLFARKLILFPLRLLYEHAPRIGNEWVIVDFIQLGT